MHLPRKAEEAVVFHALVNTEGRGEALQEHAEHRYWLWEFWDSEEKQYFVITMFFK